MCVLISMLCAPLYFISFNDDHLQTNLLRFLQSCVSGEYEMIRCHLWILSYSVSLCRKVGIRCGDYITVQFGLNSGD